MIVVLMCWVRPASAQAANTGAQAIALNATLAESLTLTLSAHTVDFALTAGSAANRGSASITATTQWVLKQGRRAVRVYAYFGNAGSALSDGFGDNIPSSAFSISDNGGAFAALNQNVPFGGARAGRRLANVRITGANRIGSRTDVMAFNIDLSTGTLPALPPGSYIGTLNVQAQATP
jgi:hypothetical protein